MMHKRLGMTLCDNYVIFCNTDNLQSCCPDLQSKLFTTGIGFFGSLTKFYHSSSNYCHIL